VTKINLSLRVTGVAPWRLAFDPCEICGGRSGTGMDFLQLLRLRRVIIIPPMPHTYLHLRVGFTRSTSGRSLGTFQEAMLFRKSQSIGQKVLSLSV